MYKRQNCDILGAEAPYAARNNHTPLRGEQQATIYYDRRRCDDMATINEFDKRIVKGFPQWQEQQ